MPECLLHVKSLHAVPLSSALVELIDSFNFITINELSKRRVGLTNTALFQCLSTLIMANANHAPNSSRSGRSKPTSKQHQSAGSRDGTPGSQQNRRGGKQSQNVNKQDTLQNGPSSTPQPPREEPHVPIGGFNAGEVLAALKAGVGTKTPVYKPDANQSAGKGNPWGMKRESNIWYFFDTD